MHISLPDSLKTFIEQQVQSGRYPSPSAYVETLIREDEKRQKEARLVQRVNTGDALPVDEHFEDRLATLLQEAEDSGEPQEMTPEDWEHLEREALGILKARTSA